MASGQSIYDEKEGGNGWTLNQYLNSDESKKLIPLIKAKFSSQCGVDNYCNRYNEDLKKQKENSSQSSPQATPLKD
jgi:hypothetical protein